MKFRIHCEKWKGNYIGSIVIEEDTIEEIQKSVNQEIHKRGWKHKHCWSEEIK